MDWRAGGTPGDGPVPPAGDIWGSSRARVALRVRLVALALLGLVSAAPALAAAPESDPEALALLRRAEQQIRPDSSTSVYRVLIVRPDWERLLRFRSHDDRAHDRFRIEVLEPEKIRGTLFLKAGRQLTMYLPKLRRAIAISPVMMHDEWMGSDFNHQDLVDAGAIINQYVHRVVGRERTAGADTVVIESIPRPDAAVAWEGLRQRVRGDGIPVEVEYRGRDGVALRRLTFHDVRALGGRQVPTRWVMQPLDHPGQRTEIVIEALEAGVEIPASVFEAPGSVARP